MCMGCVVWLVCRVRIEETPATRGIARPEYTRQRQANLDLADLPRRSLQDRDPTPARVGHGRKCLCDGVARKSRRNDFSVIRSRQVFSKRKRAQVKAKQQ